MAVSEVTSGSQSATLDTEHSLTSQTTAAVYALELDLSNMAAGDALEVYIYTKVRSGDTKDVLWQWTYYDAQAQSEKRVTSIPTMHPHYFEAAIKQTMGTGRSYAWSVRKT